MGGGALGEGVLRGGQGLEGGEGPETGVDWKVGGWGGVSVGKGRFWGWIWKGVEGLEPGVDSRGMGRVGCFCKSEYMVWGGNGGGQDWG